MWTEHDQTEERAVTRNTQEMRGSESVKAVVQDWEDTLTGDLTSFACVRGCVANGISKVD